MLFVPVNYTHAHAVTRTSELCAWTGKEPHRVVEQYAREKEAVPRQPLILLLGFRERGGLGGRAWGLVVCLLCHLQSSRSHTEQTRNS